ncbi:hypothetical protein JCM16303_002533 [Sporobolomyces ruberrimus]
MTAPPPLNLPGYLWDGKRFYKAPPQSKQPTRSASTSQESTSSKKRKKSTLNRSNGKKVGQGARLSTRSSLHEQLRDLALREWSNPTSEQLHHDVNSSALAKFESTRIIYPDCLPNEEEIVKLSFDKVNPSILRIGGSSGTIATGDLGGREELDDYLGVGGSGGYYPNDVFGFRTNWFAPNKITSLENSGQRVIATCLGPPAQAIISTTSNTISLASVTLSPRKTSLWTSAISPSLVALGGDKKVLVSTNPESADSKMEGFQTGSKSFGDGTVFALDLHNDMIFTGLRKGAMRVFDRRIKHTSSGQRNGDGASRNELELFIGAPVTNIKVLEEDPSRIVLAGMNGSLGVYDLRFPTGKRFAGSVPSASSGSKDTSPRPTSTPIITFEGHSNSVSTDQGFDTFRDQFLVAAGQDQRVRLWSLRTGGQPILPPGSSSSSSSSTAPTAPSPHSFSPAVLSALNSLPTASRATDVQTDSIFPTPTVSPWLRQFDSPIKSIKFSSYLEPIREGEDDEVYMGRLRRRRKRFEAGGGDGEGGRGEERVPKSLWVADGAGIECFGLKS